MDHRVQFHPHIKGQDLPGAINVLPAGLGELLAKRESKEFRMEQKFQSTSFSESQMNSENHKMEEKFSETTSTDRGNEIQQENLKNTLQSAITDLERDLVHKADFNETEEEIENGIREPEMPDLQIVNGFSRPPHSETHQFEGKLRLPHEFKGRTNLESVPYKPEEAELMNLPEVGKKNLNRNQEVKNKDNVKNGKIEEDILQFSMDDDNSEKVRSEHMDKQSEVDTGSLKRRNPREMYTDSAFYNPKHHPSVAEQVEMAHRLSSSLYDDGNKMSHGQEMFLKRAKKSGKWIHSSDPEFFTEDQALPHHDSVPNLKLVMNPEGKLHDWTDLSEDDLADMSNMGSTPEIAHHVVENLEQCKGRGGELFAKRRKKAEKWIVDESSLGKSAPPSMFADNFVRQSTVEDKEVNNVMFQQASSVMENGHMKTAFYEQQMMKQQQSFEIRQQQQFAEQQQQQLQQQYHSTSEMEVKNSNISLPDGMKHCSLRSRPFTPTMDLSCHNTQGIDVWATKIPRAWNASKASTLPRTATKPVKPNFSSTKVSNSTHSATTTWQKQEQEQIEKKQEKFQQQKEDVELQNQQQQIVLSKVEAYPANSHVSGIYEQQTMQHQQALFEQKSVTTAVHSSSQFMDEDLEIKKRREYEQWFKNQELEQQRLEYDCSVKYVEKELHQHQTENMIQEQVLQQNQEEERRKQMLLQKKQEEERRQQMMQQEEERRQILLQQQKEEEEKRRQMLQQEEERRQQILLQQRKEEERQQMLLQQQEEERRQQMLLLQQKQEEEKRQQILLQQQQEEEKRQQLLLQQKQEEEKRLQILQQEEEKRQQMLREEERRQQMLLQQQQEEQRRQQMLQQKLEEERRQQLLLQQQEEEERRQQLLLQQQKEEEKRQQMLLQQQQEEMRRQQMLQQKQEEERRQQLLLQEKQEEERRQKMLQQEEERRQQLLLQEEERRKQMLQQEEEIRQEEERRHQMLLLEEERRQQLLQQQQEEERRQQLLQQQQEEERRQQMLHHKQEEERRQQILLQQKQEEERRQQILLQQKQEEERRQQIVLQQQEEERRQQIMLQQQKEEEEGKQQIILQQKDVTSFKECKQQMWQRKEEYQQEQFMSFQTNRHVEEKHFQTFEQNQMISQQGYHVNNGVSGLQEQGKLQLEMGLKPIPPSEVHNLPLNETEVDFSQNKLKKTGEMFGMRSKNTPPMSDENNNYEKHSVRNLVDRFSKTKTANVPLQYLPQQYTQNENAPPLSYLHEQAKKRAYSYHEKTEYHKKQEAVEMRKAKVEQDDFAKKKKEEEKLRRNSLKEYLLMDGNGCSSNVPLVDPSAILRVDGHVNSNSSKLSADRDIESETNKWDNHNSIARGWKNAMTNYTPVTFRKKYHVEQQKPL